jgi:hypothetical protein
MLDMDILMCLGRMDAANNRAGIAYTRVLVIVIINQGHHLASEISHPRAKLKGYE